MTPAPFQKIEITEGDPITFEYDFSQDGRGNPVTSLDGWHGRYRIWDYDADPEDDALIDLTDENEGIVFAATTMSGIVSGADSKDHMPTGFDSVKNVAKSYSFCFQASMPSGDPVALVHGAFYVKPLNFKP